MFIGPDGVVPAYHIPSRELIADLVGHELDLQGIDFDQVPGRLGPVVLGLPYGIAGLPSPFPGQLGLGYVERLNQNTPSFEPVHHPAHGRGRDLDPLPGQEHDQLLLSPPGILGPELLDCLHDCGWRLGRADMPGPSALFLQGGQIIGIEPVPPTVEGLGGDAEVPAGQPGVPVLDIVVHPAEFFGRIRGDRPPADQVPDVLGPRD
ncbi:MAG: hypothetical protein MZV64_64450 [Ignavibacteriales bacterium]|nr:hypothetical protein [Ignavibacteriales bacterium]